MISNPTKISTPAGAGGGGGGVACVSSDLNPLSPDLSGVGKSCLLLRFSDGSFTTSFITTIGIDFKIRTIELDGKRIKLQIWDTAGQERFRTITTAYYRGAMGILLVYDVTDESSFNNIRNWIRNIEQHASDNVNKILVGNKADMDESKRAVPTSKGQALADEYGIKFFETSAKTNLNVEEVFFSIARDIKQRLADTDSRAEILLLNDCSHRQSKLTNRIRQGVLPKPHKNHLVAGLKRPRKSRFEMVNFSKATISMIHPLAGKKEKLILVGEVSNCDAGFDISNARDDFGVVLRDSFASGSISIHLLFFPHSIPQTIFQRPAGGGCRGGDGVVSLDLNPLFPHLSGVGKSCLLLRFSDGSFTTSFITTIGIDFKIRTIELDGKRIKLQIWDTAGQERFRTITTAYYRGAMGILLVYDVTDESSFNNIRNWIRNIEQHASDNVNKILVGNKADMDESKRAVPTSKGQALADEYGIKFFETSAKTNLNVEEVFFSIARDIKQRLADTDSRVESLIYVLLLNGCSHRQSKLTNRTRQGVLPKPRQNHLVVGLKTAKQIAIQNGLGVKGMDVLSKAALNQGMSNYVLVVYRHAVATIIIAPFAIFLDKPVIDQNLYFMGMKYTTATFAAAMTNILPAITFVLACILGLEKLNIKSIRTQAKVVGTVATVAGAMVMTLMKGPILHLFWTKATTSGGHHGEGGGGISLANSIKGSLMITIGCFSWACFMVLQAITLKTYPAELSLTAWICLLGTLEGTAVALVMERGNSSGVVCSGLAYYIQGIIMKDRGPVFVTAFSPLCMVIVAILGAFILAEQMFLGRVIGAAIIIIGLYLVVWGKSKDYKSTTKETLIDDQKQISSEIICSGKDNSHNLQIITISKSEEGTEQTITTK
ncbi:hypothetical protein G4B88_026645 [Cannabis sativa]|uniref:EamA domain-containing protein n=1 Tax=Cannabis sativa TaxID=3483 RepID=A0A7J6GR27_CANSA|nr:hypothetical protein G4B88_026645 [Cannabis sativa]